MQNRRIQLEDLLTRAETQQQQVRTFYNEIKMLITLCISLDVIIEQRKIK